jgi:hypothetical protein
MFNIIYFSRKQLCHFLINAYHKRYSTNIANDAYLNGILLTFKWSFTLLTSDAFTKKWTSFFFSINSAVTGCQRTIYNFKGKI